MVELYPTDVFDVAALACSLRAADKAELLAASGSDDYEAHVQSSVDRSRHPLTAVSAAGRVVAIFGVSPIGTLLTPVASPWLLGSDALRQHASDLVRLSRRYVAAWRETYPVLVNFVDARNCDSIRYLQAVGFTLDEPAPYGAAGLPFHRFHIGLENV